MVVGVCASALLVGCSDDDETADAACEPYLGVTAAFNGEPDPATLMPMLDALDETYLSRVRGLNEIAEARGQSLAQLSLTWVLRQPAVTSALIGASSVAQLDDSLDALDGAELTEDELAAIEPLAVDGTGR